MRDEERAIEAQYRERGDDERERQISEPALHTPTRVTVMMGVLVDATDVLFPSTRFPNLITSRRTATIVPAATMNSSPSCSWKVSAGVSMLVVGEYQHRMVIRTGPDL